MSTLSNSECSSFFNILKVARVHEVLFLHKIHKQSNKNSTKTFLQLQIINFAVDSSLVAKINYKH